MNRKYVLMTVCLFMALFDVLASSSETLVSQKKEIYEWRIYTLTGDGTSLDGFFESTLIPAYNRLGVSVGAFTLYKKEDKELRYLLLVYPDIKTFQKVKQDIWKDQVFRKAAQPFFDATASNPLYSNFETFLCEAFDRIPKLKMPDKDRTLFELRIYHSPNEEANQRKVKMFNKDEIAVFDQVGIHSVCYGEVLAGPRMPALVYLTWYKDKPARDKAWSAFGSHPDWIRIKDLPEYAHTATNNKNRLLLPMPYSQF